ncbi:MAG: glycoside hydrolase family 5 protein [Bifidobacteriaceae bacterium]|jgi:aryl-phospho-beta-D-glucosidase BglC (GH1 family)|nr:glycoside hydrolase family 5 protein [Bifidobacteriaceae bacterium]MCI1978639.1 glycoside hydrolase family 5 protein [Bifidobacteriaceae bacterium]
MILEKYRNGINLGGWLAQYDINEPAPFNESQRKKHFETFITEEDIDRISHWGLDHVRLPIDGRHLLDPHGNLLPEAMEALQRCISWCAHRGLNIIIDLHDFEGNIYGEMSTPIPLLTRPDLEARFLHFWSSFAQQFVEYPGDFLMFELFNEISDASSYLWRRLYLKAIHSIRQIDADRWILVGSNHQNSVDYLPELNIVEDSHVFYNFHYYDPQVFTHQHAHFSEEFSDFDTTVTYPGDISSFRDYLHLHPQWLSKHSLTAEEETNDFSLMQRLLSDAFTFSKYSGKELYCGEFGVIDSAPPLEAAKWIKDFEHLADSCGFGHALWNYKTLDFGLLDAAGEAVHPELISALFDH